MVDKHISFQSCVSNPLDNLASPPIDVEAAARRGPSVFEAPSVTSLDMAYGNGNIFEWFLWFRPVGDEFRPLLRPDSVHKKAVRNAGCPRHVE
jgi:hypothetical protein